MCIVLHRFTLLDHFAQTPVFPKTGMVGMNMDGENSALQTMLMFQNDFWYVQSSFLLYYLPHAFKINDDHLKICLILVGLSFVSYQMTSSVY